MAAAKRASEAQNAGFPRWRNASGRRHASRWRSVEAGRATLSSKTPLALLGQHQPRVGGPRAEPGAGFSQAQSRGSHRPRPARCTPFVGSRDEPDEPAVPSSSKASASPTVGQPPGQPRERRCAYRKPGKNKNTTRRWSPPRPPRRRPRPGRRRRRPRLSSAATSARCSSTACRGRT